MAVLVRRLLSVLLVLVAGLALGVTVYALGGAFGYYRVIAGSPSTVGDLSSVAVAGGTLFLGAATALLTLSTRAAAAETRDDARVARETARARLDIIFDKAQPALWAADLEHVRVMVVNNGPAMAHHVVVTLEGIDPNHPMLNAQYQVPNGPLSNGVNILPSRLVWKGHDHRRDFEDVCDLNPHSRDNFDVLRYSWQGNSPWAVFWIHEWREAVGLGAKFEGSQPPSPLVLNTTYTLHISATAANADRVERVFSFRASATMPHFDFLAT